MQGLLASPIYWLGLLASVLGLPAIPSNPVATPMAVVKKVDKMFSFMHLIIISNKLLQIQFKTTGLSLIKRQSVT